MQKIWVSLVFGLVSTGAFGLDFPESTRIGDAELIKVADVKRSLLLWDLYQITVYAPQGSDVREVLLAEDRPTALALTCLYSGGFPDKMPKDWQENILPVLSDKEQALLAENFSTAGQNDTIWIAFDPDRGGWMGLNDKILIRQPDKELVSAFLNLWLDDHPISRKLNKSLENVAD